jgi:hypothetical protein
MTAAPNTVRPAPSPFAVLYLPQLLVGNIEKSELFLPFTFAAAGGEGV